MCGGAAVSVYFTPHLYFSTSPLLPTSLPLLARRHPDLHQAVRCAAELARAVAAPHLLSVVGAVK
jgi:hypothetical protein